MTDESLFAHAIALPDRADRAALLDRECPDPDQRARVERLLAAHKDDSFLEPPSPADLELGDTASLGDDRETITRPGSNAADLPVGGAFAAPPVPGHELLEVLGEGGMGIVYKARQAAVNRVVALKMIRGGFGSAAERARFRAEAEAAAKLTHPGIARVYEFGESAGALYFTLEFCDGGSLAEKLDGTPWQPGAAARLAEMLADAVAAAHAQGIVHRDLKPANVLLASPPGSGGGAGDSAAQTLLYDSLRAQHGALPKITDFGISKRMDSPDGPTATGAVMGTPSYMAPEQARGDSKSVGPAADVYALGAILYELLAGRPPFKAAGVAETLDQVRNREPVAVRALNPACPRDLETICLKCLQKDPAKRYAGAAELADDLRRFQEGRTITARPVGPRERAWRWCRRNPVVAGLLAALLVTGAAGFTAVLLALDAERAQRQIAESNERDARDATREAERKTRDEAAARQREESAKLAALDARGKEEKAKNDALDARTKEEKAKTDAIEARNAAEARRRQADAALYSAQLNAALRHLLDNNPVLARQVLDACRWDLRGWEWHHLRELAEGSTHTLAAHTDLAQVVQFSPDGRRLLTAGPEPLCKLWDTWSGREVATIPLPYPIGARGPYLFSPDGRFILLPGQDRTVVQYETATGRVHRRHPWRLDELQQLGFTPDGRHVAAVVRTAAKDGSVRHALAVTGAEDGKGVLAAADLVGAVNGLRFSADGKHVAVALVAAGAKGGAVTELCVWELGKEKPAVLKDFPGPLAGWMLSGDGQRLATVAHFTDAAKRVAGSRVQLWDADGKGEPVTLHEQQKPLAPDGRSQSQIVSLAASADGARLATLGIAVEGKGLFKMEARVFDIEPAEEVSAASWTEAQLGASRLLSFSPDAKRLNVSAWSEYNPRLSPPPPNFWLRALDAATGKELRLVREVAEARPALSPDGARMATFGGDPKFTNLGEVRVWDLGRGEVVARLRGHSGVVYSATVSRDGRCIASASFDGTVKLWDSSPTRSLPADFSPYAPLSGSRSGERVVTAESLARPGAPPNSPGERVLKVWDYGAAAPRVIPVEADVRARSLPAQAAAAVGLAGQPAVAAPLLARPAPLVGTLHGTLSPDGRWVAACFEHNPNATKVIATSPVWVYDVDSGKLLYQVPNHTGAAISRTFSPDGRLLAVLEGGFRSELVRAAKFGLRDFVAWHWHPSVLAVYESATGRELFRLPAESHQADSITFSPGGRHLVTSVWERDPAPRPVGRDGAKDDRRHKVWDARTGALVYALPEGAGGVLVSPDDRRLAYSSGGLINVVDLEQGKELARFGPARSLLAFTPDGKHLVANVGPRRMQMWEADTGKELTLLRNQPAAPAAISPLAGARRPTLLDSLWSFVTFAPDAERLLFVEDASVGVFDPTTGVELVRIPAERIFTPSELLCLRRDYSNRIRTLREFQAFRPRPARPQERVIQHTLAEHELAFSPDGRTLLALDRRGWNASSPQERGLPELGRATQAAEQLAAWDLATGQEAYAIPTASRGPLGASQHHALSADGLRLAEVVTRKEPDKSEVASELIVSNPTSRRVLFKVNLPHSVTAPALSPDGARLAAAVAIYDPDAKTLRKEVRVWDVASGKELRKWALPNVSVSAAALRFSADGTRLALASEAGFGARLYGKPELPSETVLLWDVASGKELLRHDHKHRVRDIVLAADGKTLTWLSAAVEPEVVRPRPPGVIGENPFGNLSFNRLRITGLEVKSWREGGEVKAFPIRADLNPPPPGPLEVRLFNEEFVRVAFTPDGSHLALVHARRRVKVWDTTNGEEIASLPPQGKDVHYLAFSPDGRRLVTVAQVVDTGPKIPDFDLPGTVSHSFYDPVTEAQRAPEVRVWDVAASRLVVTYRPHLDRVEGVALDPTGKRLATASRDGTIKLRELPP